VTGNKNHLSRGRRDLTGHSKYRPFGRGDPNRSAQIPALRPSESSVGLQNRPKTVGRQAGRQALSRVFYRPLWPVKSPKKALWPESAGKKNTGYVHDFSKIAVPLITLTKRNVSKWQSSTSWIVWTKECQQSFDTLISALVDAPALMIPDFNLPFKVITDASDYALGAILIHQGTVFF
jgi:hypothetical protein